MTRGKSKFDGLKDGYSKNLVLSTDIDSESVGEIIEAILDLNTIDDELESELKDYVREPIKLIINSFGGSVYDGFALISVIETSKTPIHGYCYGSAMSMGFAVFISTHLRFAHRLSTFMYHEISDTFFGNITGAKQNLKECDRLQKMYDEYVLSKTKLPLNKITDYKNRKEDWYLSAQEAYKYKVVDFLI